MELINELKDVFELATRATKFVKELIEYNEENGCHDSGDSA